MAEVDITVYGTPAPQGSKTVFPNGGMRESSKYVKPWREAVKSAALDVLGKADHGPLHGPLEVDMCFYFARPKGHYGTGRNAGRLKLSAPPFPAGIPDLSKLARATEDALTEAGAWKDDAQIVRYALLAKHYCAAPFILPGAHVVIRQLMTR